MANRTVLIPSETDPFVVKLNFDTYSYPAGTEQSVPDEVADVIDNYWRNQPKDPGVAYDARYTKKDVDDSVDTTNKLPAVTSADEGKVLTVDDEGKFVVGSAGASYLEVLFTIDEEENFTCNHTYAEIATAINDNITIIARFAYGIETVIQFFDVVPQLNDNIILFVRQQIDIDDITSKANINTTTITYTENALTGAANNYVWSVTNND